MPNDWPMTTLAHALPAGPLPTMPNMNLGGQQFTAPQYDALFAEEAYQDNDVSDKNPRKNVIGSYVLDHELSTPSSGVYHNPRTGDTYIGYRGTANKEEAKKYWPNIIKGDLARSDRLANSLATYDAVAAKYGGKPRVVGHSLGGQVAKQVARERKTTGAGFNVGSSIFGSDAEVADICKNKSTTESICNNFVSNRIEGDIASVSEDDMGGINSKTYKLASGFPVVNSHFMNQFLTPTGDYWNQAKSFGAARILPESIEPAPEPPHPETGLQSLYQYLPHW